MKKRYIACIMAIVVGIICISWGTAHQGIKAVTWDHETNRLVILKKVSQTKHLAAFDKLVINTKLPVVVKPGDGNRVTVRQQAANQRKHPVTTTVKNKTLTVSGGDNRQHSIAIHGLAITTDDEAFDTDGAIIITVPKQTSLETLDLQKSWSVRLEDLTLKNVLGSTGGSFQAKNVIFKQNLDLSRGDADIYLTNVTAPKVTARTSDGDIYVKQSHLKSTANLLNTTDGDITLSTTTLGGGDLRSSDGDIHVRNNTVAKTLTAQTYEGDLSGLVPETAGVSVKGTTDSDIELFGRSRGANAQVRPNATSQYRFIAGDDGDITVR